MFFWETHSIQHFWAINYLCLGAFDSLYYFVHVENNVWVGKMLPIWIKIQKVWVLEFKIMSRLSTNRLHPNLPKRKKIFWGKNMGERKHQHKPLYKHTTCFSLGLGKSFCMLHCPRCSVNYIVILPWGRAANIMITLYHSGEVCVVLSVRGANLYLSPTGSRGRVWGCCNCWPCK